MCATLYVCHRGHPNEVRNEHKPSLEAHAVDEREDDAQPQNVLAARAERVERAVVVQPREAPCRGEHVDEGDQSKDPDVERAVHWHEALALLGEPAELGVQQVLLLRLLRLLVRLQIACAKSDTFDVRRCGKVTLAKLDLNLHAPAQHCEQQVLLHLSLLCLHPKLTQPLHIGAPVPHAEHQHANVRYAVNLFTTSAAGAKRAAVFFRDIRMVSAS